MIASYTYGKNLWEVLLISYIKNLIFIFVKQSNYITSKPMGSKKEYLNLHEECKKDLYPDITKIETELGYSIDTEYYENLALHTQICIKRSKLNYQHGRLLYSYLSKFLDEQHKKEKKDIVNIFETGTARGFSSICMSKALIDSQVVGNIVTCDLIPHNHLMYWNCIDDMDGKKTREQLLEKWSKELEFIIFLNGKTKKTISKIGKSRIHFAFLDAQHKYVDVMSEYNFVSKRQKKGDYIIFDDVTKKLFPGVFKAVKAIDTKNEYSIKYIFPSDERGYAIAVKN